MNAGVRVLWFAALGLGVATGCIAPDERRPGLWLPGESASPPSDWAFTDDHPEIALEVATPYGLAHSVTIWCVSVDGALYIGARDPDEKNWPGWVEKDPAIRLGIDGKVYDGTLTRLEDPDTIRSLQGAYAAKYDLPPRTSGEGPAMRYWRVNSGES